MPAASAPRIAVAGSRERTHLHDAVAAGGGELTRAADAEGLVWAGTRAPEALGELLRTHPGIRWIQLPGAGIDRFAAAGVLDGDRLWTSGKGAYALPVAEHALALALAGLRDLKRFAHARGWGEQGGISLVGGRVTIFGAGGTTRRLIGMLEPFGCSVTVVRRRQEAVAGADRVLGFDERYEALRGADVVFLALALTDETRGIIGEIELELMEPHAWLVNVARGEHVVTDHLTSALREDAIGGAALDVTHPEPLPDEHPLWDLPNCLITPHTANTEDMATPLLAARITENVRRFAAGEQLLGLVDPSAGY